MTIYSISIIQIQEELNDKSIILTDLNNTYVNIGKKVFNNTLQIIYIYSIITYILYIL